MELIATNGQKLLEWLQNDTGTWFVILLGVGLILHSYYRTKSTEEAERNASASPQAHGIAENSSLELESAPTDSAQNAAHRGSPGFWRCLYLGQVIFSCGRAHEHLLGISMECFNGSAEEIDVLSVRGQIRAKEASNGEKNVDYGRLETPQTSGDGTSTHKIKPFSEFRLSLLQPIPGEMANRLLSGDNTEVVELGFDFEELDIQICKSSDYSARGSLPLWDGARFLRLSDHYCTHRSVIIRPRSGAAEAG